MTAERDDLLAALSAADPIDLAAVPGPDRDCFEEIVMQPIQTETPLTSPATSRRRALIAAAVLAAAAGVGGGALALSGNDGKAADPQPTDATTAPGGKVAGIDPAPRTGQRAGEVMSSCIVWDVSALDGVEYAFDGTVTAIDDGWATFEVGEWFKGPGGDLVVLNAEALIPREPGEAATSVDETLISEIGGRFLVSGSDGYAGVCNHTQAYSEAEADAWRNHLSA